jgi:drug/metabolite transporter (DMT)-like permease
MKSNCVASAGTGTHKLSLMKIHRGVWAALGAAVLFGLSTPLAKLLLADTSPLLLAGLLYTGSGVGLAIILAFRVTMNRSSIVWPRGSSIGWLLGAALFGGAIAPYLLMQGLAQTDSATASLALNLEGVFTALLAWFAFNENYDRRVFFGMALIIAGGVILSIGPTHAAGVLGPLLIASACLAWAIDNNLTRKVSINDAMLVACTKGLIAGPANVVIALRSGLSLPPALEMLQAGFLGFVGYGLSLTLFVIALRHVGTARTGAYFSVAPFLGATLAVILGAPLTLSLVLAGVIMGIGVWLHLTERHQHLHRHEPLDHAHSHSHDSHHQHSHGPDWDGKEPHSHPHAHEPVEHAHAHFPDIHHQHKHS